MRISLKKKKVDLEYRLTMSFIYLFLISFYYEVKITLIGDYEFLMPG